MNNIQLLLGLIFHTLHLEPTAFLRPHTSKLVVLQQGRKGIGEVVSTGRLKERRERRGKKSDGENVLLKSRLGPVYPVVVGWIN